MEAIWAFIEASSPSLMLYSFSLSSAISTIFTSKRTPTSHLQQLLLPPLTLSLTQLLFLFLSRLISLSISCSSLLWTKHMAHLRSRRWRRQRVDRNASTITDQKVPNRGRGRSQLPKCHPRRWSIMRVGNTTEQWRNAISGNPHHYFLVPINSSWPPHHNGTLCSWWKYPDC